MKNIIFLIDAQKGPSGGGKVIYQYSNYINSLKNFKSEIIYLEKKKKVKWINSIKKKLHIDQVIETGWKFNDLKIKKNYKFPWFNLKTKTKNNFIFNKKKDFVVLPEIFAHFAEDFLIKEKIPYAIFVQNGYAIFPTNNLRKLNVAYRKAKFILSYSEDINECIALAFPFALKKILKVKYSIEPEKFYFNFKRKKNIISYMPRKMSKHSELVISFLKNSLSKKWKIKALHNLTENEVYKKLSESKIFLAFSDLEGLPLPPVEAALLGNKVIGYTGEGGKEYWQGPIFTEIHSGQIKNFCSYILSNLKLKNFFKKTSRQRNMLAQNFSKNIEKKYLDNFLKKI